MEFSICVVLYKPNDKQIEQLVNYIDRCDYIFVYNNSNDDIYDRLSKLIGNKLEYFYDGLNHGISEAYNTMAERATILKQKFLLFLDQDSLVTKVDLDIIKNFKKNEIDNDVAIFAIENEYSSKQKKYNKYFDELTFSITSGSVMNLSVFNELGGYDNKLFIDGVDRDYCLTVVSRGYRIFGIRKTRLVHTLGSGKPNFFGIYEHSALRNYYIYRNRKYVMKKHNKQFSFNEILRSKYLAVLKQIMSIICFEQDKKMKLRSLVQAENDYKNGKMGKREDKCT